MSSKIKNYLIIVLAASTVCVGVLAWRQSTQLDVLRASLANATAPAPAPKEPAAPPPMPPAPATTETTAKAAPAPDATDTPPAPPSRAGRRFAALLANPEFAKAMSLQQRAALDARYADLFKQLKLSPDALERFKDLLVERQTARMDVMTAASENGLTPRDNRDEIQRLISQAQADVDANIKTALGDTAFAQYKNFDGTQSQRTVVSSLDQRLSYSGTALTPAQSDFLIQTLSPGDASASGMPGPPGFNGGARAKITDEVLAKAKNVLYPDQLRALEQLKEEQDAQQKLGEIFRMRAGPKN